jgi:V/A-type H+-transporting ATPase subunit I
MLRPSPARWFEVLAARDDATLVLEALASTGAVELESRAGSDGVSDLVPVMALLAQFLELKARYHAYWPAPQDCRPSATPEAPGATMQRCLGALKAWAQDAEPVIRRLQRCQAEISALQRWQRVLEALATSGLDLSRLAAAGPLLSVQLFVLPVGTDTEMLPDLVAAGTKALTTALSIDEQPHLLATGSPTALQTMAQHVSSLKGSGHLVPIGLGADAAANRAHIAQTLTAIGAEQASQQTALLTISQRHSLPRMLGDAYRLDWLLNNVQSLEAGALFCWITGWSSHADADTLAKALQACSARALLHYAQPPAGLQAPLLLRNPPWARPFEIFSRALGMPSASEADPTPLLAVIVPLMFGYMFGDVGQGLLLASAAWWFRDRFPVARLLMVGGLSAAFFGLLFGSVFGLHQLLPAWWLHPLSSPLPVLLAPLAGGALLLTLGLALDALAAWWRGAMQRWLMTDAWLIVVYIGLLSAFFTPAGWVLAAVGTMAFCGGHAISSHRLKAMPKALGELVEKTLQLLINTLSFARVGAFALAHAGLSSAIVALVDAADSLVAKVVVMVLGNAVVIVLEVMVVAIQTTRLVLFEFFTRFMQGQGRAFHRLPAPPFTPSEKTP